MKALAIYGSGGLGVEIAQTAFEIQETGVRWSEVVFIDDVTTEKSVNGLRVACYTNFRAAYDPSDAEFIIGVGEPASRNKLRQQLEADGYLLARLVHPSASVSEHSSIGPGTVVQYGSRVAPNSVIGGNVLLNSHSSIGHNCSIGDGCVISSFVPIGGGTTVGDSTFVGMGAIIRDHLTIGSNCIISMGSVVYKNVEDGMLAMGNPARCMMTSKEGVFH